MAVCWINNYLKSKNSGHVDLNEKNQHTIRAKLSIEAKMTTWSQCELASYIPSHYATWGQLFFSFSQVASTLEKEIFQRSLDTMYASINCFEKWLSRYIHSSHDFIATYIPYHVHHVGKQISAPLWTPLGILQTLSPTSYSNGIIISLCHLPL